MPGKLLDIIDAMKLKMLLKSLISPIKTTESKFTLFLLFFLFASAPTYAQLQEPDLTGKTYDEKLALWLDYCKKSSKIASEGKPNFTRLMFIEVARKGFTLCRKDDLKNIAQYQYIIGRIYQQLKQLDSAVFYMEKARDNYKSSKMLKDEISAMQFLNYVYYQTGKFAKREANINQMKLKLGQTTDLRTKSFLVSSIGEYYYDGASYENAIKYKLESIKLLNKLILTKEKVEVDKGNLSIVNLQIAETYIKMKQFENALAYLEIFEKTKPVIVSKLTMTGVYNDYIMVYLGLNKVNKALAEFDKLKNLKDNEFKFDEEISSANRNFAEYYLQQKQLNVALKYSKHAETLPKIKGKLKPILEQNILLGKVAYSEGNYQDAIKYFKICLPNAYDFGKENYAIINKSLALSYAANKDFENAYKHYNIYAKLQDTLYDDASKKTIAEMDAKYHREASKQEIRLLNLESKNKSNQLKEERKTRLILIAAALFAFFSACLIYWNYRNKQRLNVILDTKNQELDIINSQLNNANQTKAKLFSIISHDLRSPVSQLFTFLRIQLVKPNQISEDEKLTHQKKIMASATNLLATMEDLLIWSKSQMEHFELDIEEINIDQLFEESIALMQNQAEAKNLEIKMGNLTFNKLKSDQNLLVIVLRNLLQNAINNAYNNTSILLNAGINEEKKPYISIVNNGDIIPQEKIDELLSSQHVKSKSSGYGLVIVKELLQKIDSSLKITSYNELTTVQITF